MIEIITNNWN